MTDKRLFKRQKRELKKNKKTEKKQSKSRALVRQELTNCKHFLTIWNRKVKFLGKLKLVACRKAPMLRISLNT